METEPEYSSKNVVKSDLSKFSLHGDSRVFDTINEQSDAQPIHVQKDPDLGIDGWYNLYKQFPTHDNKNKVIRALTPSINYALGSLNATDDPLIRAKAKVYASRAIDKFDPSYGVNLNTYVSSQLRKLTRTVRDMRNPIKIPEAQIYEAQALAEAEQKFIDEHGREPDLTELSDASGMSLKKIGDIRSKYIKQVSESQYYTGGGSDESDDRSTSAAEEGMENADFTEEALRYVHAGLNHRDKKILEWTTGMYGSKQLSPAEISMRLKVSQSQISRILNKLAQDVNSTMQGLSKTYTGVKAQ